MRGLAQALTAARQERAVGGPGVAAVPALFDGLEEVQCTLAVLLRRDVLQDDVLQLLHLWHAHPAPPLPPPLPPEAGVAARADPHRRGKESGRARARQRAQRSGRSAGHQRRQGSRRAQRGNASLCGPPQTQRRRSSPAHAAAPRPAPAVCHAAAATRLLPSARPRCVRAREAARRTITPTTRPGPGRVGAPVARAAMALRAPPRPSALPRTCSPAPSGAACG
jgi:hypothetical protein